MKALVLMDRSDEVLAAGAQAGESDAFDELARRHRSSLVRLAASLIGDADEAENLAQEALTRALTTLASYQAHRPFGPWLRGILLNLCRNHLRDRGRRARPVDPDRLGSTAAPEGRRRGVLSAIIRREIGEQTLRAIAQLPLPLREVFVLRFVEGMDYAEISQLTGLAPPTLRVRAHRARALLRDSLGSVVDTWLRQSRPDPPAPEDA
jgi:RNA polymerase sigma factor (sigma-70 family)